MKYFLIISSIFIFGNSFSQSEIAFKSKVKENEILLRWTPVKPELFRTAMQNGFVLSRKVWEGDGNPPASFWETDVDFSVEIKVYSKESDIWKKTFEANDDVGVLYSYIFPEKKMSEMDEENFFGLALLTCDLHPELAELSGLFFRDTNIQNRKNYAYRIEINKIKIQSVILVNSERLTILPIINDLELKNMNESAEISWNYKVLQESYSGYFLEWSEDSVNFKIINERAIIPMASQYEKDKTINYYSDSAVVGNRNYWYRISGRDHFGELGKPSAPEKIFIAPELKGEILIDTIFLSDGKIKLKWSITNENDLVSVKDIRILSSGKIAGKYELLKQIDKKETEILIELSERENYIKVVASAGNNQVESWPYLFLLPDLTPPSVPDSLTGMIDKEGKVTLKWRKNSEKDLRGYRVFRTNALHESMVEVSKNFIIGDSYQDSVDINSLTEEIYFSINAVDSNYNNSELSKPIKLEKPDHIPPVAAPIVKVTPLETGNYVQWNVSTSKDFSKTEIVRSEKGKAFLKVFAFHDTVSRFIDTSILAETDYHYKTIVYDDADNFAESESVYLYNPIQKNKLNDSVSVEVDRKEKFIFLKWNPLPEEVYSYFIYKAKKGETMRFFRTVNGKSTELKDTELYISNEYVYSIKAVLKSGREVMLKENLIVKF